MNCKICGAPYESGDTICKNCGCDLPRINSAADTGTNLAEKKPEQISPTPVDIARKDILLKGDEHDKVFTTLKALLIAALLCFILPLTTYKFTGMSEDIANGMNALLGKEVYTVTNPEPQTLSGFGHITLTEFKDENGTKYTVGNNVYVKISIVAIVVSILFCFLPINERRRDIIISGLCAIAFFMLLYHMMTSSNAGVKATMQIGFYIESALLIASAAVSTYLKATE